MKSQRAFQPSIPTIWLMLFPGLLVYGGVVMTPMVGGVYFSLFESRNYDFFWNGLGNYVRLWNDDGFWFQLRNNMILIALTVTFQVTTAFVIAVLMNNRTVVAPKFLRTVIFFPVILSPVVTSFVWVLVYDFNSGLLNRLLDLVGLGEYRQLWLDNPDLAIYSVTATLIWQYLGLFLVIFLSGLSAINREIIEAAEVDGASTWQQTLFVIFPQLAPAWSVALVLAISNGLKVFEQIFIMTGGGPGTASSVISLYAYNQSFMRADFAYGNTIAVTIIVLSLAFVTLALRLLNRLIGGDRQ